MKRLMMVTLTALASAAVFAGEPVAGGIKFTSAVNVDGTDYPANTTIYAESYPTQFVVKPVVEDGHYIYYGTYDKDHGEQKIYPDYTGTTFLLMPPPTSGDVATFTVSSFENFVWADANTTVPDEEQDGTEKKPYRILQKAVDAMNAKSKSYNMVLVKRGDYKEGGTAKTGSALASRVAVPSKSAFIVRAIEGPAVTTIFGEKDTKSGESAPYVGWGENGVRCVRLTAGAALQGFTLRDGSGARKTSNVTDYKNGGAVSGEGSDKSVMLDCIISNGCANVGVVVGAKVIRCRFIDNQTRTCLLSDAPAYSCAFTKNVLVESGSTFSYFNASPLQNCTFAGNAKINNGLPATAVNSVFQGVSKVSGTEGGSGNWVWDVGSGTPPTPAYTVQDPKLGEVAEGDLRLGETSPCIGAIDTLPEDYWKTATGDVDGNRLHVTADGKLTPGALQAEFSELYANELYVDPVNGKDTNDGWKRNRALKTLQAAMTHKKCAAGTTVYVEPGVYDTGTMPSDASEVLNRVSVPADVSLVSLGSASDTFLIGAAATDETAPTRCVHLHNNSSIRGFTLTGGHTDSTENGGGVYAPSSSSGACVYDCVITNNVSAKRAGAASSCSLHRCYIADNSSSDGVGTALVGGALYNCIVDSQKRGGSRCYTTSTVRNCTFLPTKTADAQEAVNYASAHSADHCYNSIFLCQARWDAQEYTDCIIATNSVDAVKRTYDPEVLGPTVKLLTMAECGVRADGTLRRNSPAVDAGYNALYDAAWGDVDIKGSPRIINGTIDIGACELDPSLLKGLMLLVK